MLYSSKKVVYDVHKVQLAYCIIHFQYNNAE